MAIIDFADMVLAYPSLQNGSFKAEDVNSYHIPYAQAELETLLASKYTVPFSSNNMTAKEMVRQLTYARIAPVGMDDREKIRDRVISLVDRLLDGSAVMMTDSGALSPDASSGIWLSTEDYHPVFTVDKPEHWVIDEDQIEDLRDERDQG